MQHCRLKLARKRVSLNGSDKQLTTPTATILSTISAQRTEDVPEPESQAISLLGYRWLPAKNAMLPWISYVISTKKAALA